MLTSQKGNVTEAKVISELVSEGYRVFEPFGDGSRTDLVVDTGKKLLRCQCKSCTIKGKRNGAAQVRLVSSNARTAEKERYPEIDIFATYNPKTEEVYGILPEDAPGNSKIQIRFKPPENEISSIRYADDYDLIERLPDADFERHRCKHEWSGNNERGGTEIFHCSHCGKEFERALSAKSENNYCSTDCAHKAQTKIDWPDTEWLEKMVDEYSYLALSRRLGVSDNAIRKRIRNHGG